MRHLFDARKDEIEAQNRPMGIFTTTGWKNVVSKFAEKSGDRRTKKTIEEQVRCLEKKECSIFMEFKNCATSFGRDAEKNC